MRFKKIPTDILGCDNLNEVVDKLPWRNFAQHVDELDGFIFLEERFLKTTDYRESIEKTIKYLRSNL